MAVDAGPAIPPTPLLRPRGQDRRALVRAARGGPAGGGRPAARLGRAAVRGDRGYRAAGGPRGGAEEGARGGPRRRRDRGGAARWWRGGGSQGKARRRHCGAEQAPARPGRQRVRWRSPEPRGLCPRRAAAHAAARGVSAWPGPAGGGGGRLELWEG